MCWLKCIYVLCVVVKVCHLCEVVGLKFLHEKNSNAKYPFLKALGSYLVLYYEYYVLSLQLLVIDYACLKTYILSPFIASETL